MSASANKNPNSSPARPEDDGPLKNLEGKLGSDAPLYYPQNITTVDNYMIFAAYKEHAFQGATPGMSRQNMDKVGSVILPMPSNLTVGYQQSYKEEAIGAAGMAIAGAIGNDQATARASLDAMGAKAREGAGGAAATDAQNKALSALGERAKKALGGGGGVGATLNIASGPVGAGIVASLPGVGPVAAGVAQKGVQAGMAVAGIARNPHMAVLYDTPQFRAFQFGFEFRPKSFQESLMIQRIIHFFKFYSHPEYEMEGHFFKYPNQFKLSYKYPEFLHRFGDTVCKSVTVDYHGEGTPLYYDASTGSRKMKAPAVVKMQVDFQEVKILTKKEIMDKGR